MRIDKYFDKIYLLNLYKRKDRLIKSTTKLNSHQIDFEVFNGVDGSTLNKLWEVFNNPYFGNTSYLGCAISHLSIYQDAIQNSYEKILIIEDDNLIHDKIHDIFNSLEIPEWKDLFYLGYIPLSEDCTMWDYRFGIQGHNMINESIFRPSNLWGLYAYGITIELMKNIIEVYNKDFPMELDRYFVKNIQPLGNSIAIAPQLFCCEDNVYSDNLGYALSGMTERSIDRRFSIPENYN